MEVYAQIVYLKKIQTENEFSKFFSHYRLEFVVGFHL